MQDDLIGTAEDCGTFGHETYPGKDDVLATGKLGSVDGESIRVADEIGEFRNALSLVVVGEEAEFVFMLFAEGLNSGGKLRFWKIF